MIKIILAALVVSGVSIPFLNAAHKPAIEQKQIVATVNKTTQPCSTLSKEEMLTAKPWRVDEVYHIIDGKLSSFKLNGKNTTGIRYNRMTFEFDKDGTGSTVQEDGTEYSFSWYFPTPEQDRLIIAVGRTVYNWELLQITEKYVHASCPLTFIGDGNNLESFRLVQQSDNAELIVAK